MNEPARLRDEGPDDVRALIRAGASTRPMTREERRRTSTRLGRYAAAAALAGGVAWLPAAAFGAGAGVATVILAWGVPALLAPAPPPRVADPLVTVAPHAARPAEPSPAPLVSPAPSPDPSPAVPAPSGPRAPAATPAMATKPPPEAPARTSGDAPDPLAEEAALLESARAALGTRPAEALALAEAHAARFPSGKLGMERELVAVDALRRLHRGDEARARGEALLARARGSLYEDRVHALLEGLP